MNNQESVYNFYKLKTWTDPHRILWWNLVTRENAIPFIEKHIDILDNDCLEKLSRNPFAVYMLKNHIDKIKWNEFVKNPNAMHVIDEHFDICVKSINSYGKMNLLRHPNFIHIINTHMDKIIDELLPSSCLYVLIKSTNPIYIDLLEKFIKKYPEKIIANFWNDLCENPAATHIIQQNLQKLSGYAWQVLAKNPNAIHIIEDNLHKIDELGWRYLSKNPNAIPVLEKNIDKINWYNLSENPNGIHILEKYPEKIVCYLFFDYENFSVNAPIFEIDYDAIRNRCSIYKEELMLVALHPSRIEQYLAQGISPDELDKFI